MKITADFILNEGGTLVSNMALDVRHDGTIAEITSTTGNQDDIRKYDGILIPGLFNCHAHLEPADADFGEINGLGDFLAKMKDYRKEHIYILNTNHISRLDRYLYDQGIEFCADIANTQHTLQIKTGSKITYHTFIEIFETLSDNSSEKFENALHIEKKFSEMNLKSSLAPHSCYSISPEMIKHLGLYNAENKNITTIHFKESFKENELFEFQKEVYNTQKNNQIEIFLKKFSPKNISDVFIELFDREQRVICVHSIYLNQKDLDFLLKTQKNCALCICPVSNLNIEKKMAEKEHLGFFPEKVFFGTDSPASNPEMKLMKDLYLAQKEYQFSLEKILQMATSHPAKYFQVRDKGILKSGTKPGITLLRNIDLNGMRITGESETVRLF